MRLNSRHRRYSSRRGSRRGPLSRWRRLNLEMLEPRYVLSSDLVISEFMAANDGVLLDNYGAESDWIEIHNRSAAPIDLNGYYLTDDEDDLDQWQFPNVSIAAGGYLVVFASGQDDRDPLLPLHTNFSLATEGE
jgi:Lamin Tail Domain